MTLDTGQAVKKVYIIPCSGIGKALGTIGREATYIVADELQPSKTDTLCLSLLTMKDPESQRIIQSHPTITIDGCPKFCAKINVEKCGGVPIESFKVFDIYREHKDLKSPSVSNIGENGFKLAKILAELVSEKINDIFHSKE